MPLHRIVTALLVALAVAATGVVELLVDGFSGFFLDHALIAGLVSGVLLSLLVVVGVEAVVHEAREVRWEPVRLTSFQALAYETTLVIDTLNWLVTGHLPENEAASEPEAQQRLRSLHGRAGLDPTPPALAHALPEADYRERLAPLLDDGGWCAFAQNAIARRRVVQRDGLARWASALLASRELVRVFARLARQNDALGTLESWLRQRRRALEAGRGGSSAPAEDAWVDVLAECISLREDLLRLSIELGATWEAFRQPVSRRHGKRLAERAATSKKRWRAVLVDPLVPAFASPKPTERD